MGGQIRTVDADEAVSDIAYRLSEVVAIYPITPASVMGEHADQWAADGRVNLGAASRKSWKCSPKAGRRVRCTAR
jgi:pyruvate/2-oxoacid:ferredoxin oxidoreductase alpha subunit